MQCEICIDGPSVASSPDMSVHTIPADTSVVCLEAATAFDGLTPKEQAYAYHLSRADWQGAKICLLQTSPESVPVFALLQLIFSATSSVKVLVAAAKAKGLTDDELGKIMIYCAAFYGNVKALGGSSNPLA